MTKRPERKRSQLAGLSPVAPTTGRTEAEQPAPAAATPATPQRTTAASSKKAGNRVKVAYYATPEESERIRAAFIAARNAGKPWRTLSDFQFDAVFAQVAQIEAELNGGQPFEGVPPYTLSPGRPME